MLFWDFLGSTVEVLISALTFVSKASLPLIEPKIGEYLLVSIRDFSFVVAFRWSHSRLRIYLLR